MKFLFSVVIVLFGEDPLLKKGQVQARGPVQPDLQKGPSSFAPLGRRARFAQEVDDG